MNAVINLNNYIKKENTPFSAVIKHTVVYV